MLTGYNTDFKFQGKVYHCQTEDGGTGSPYITSLLYHHGAILASRKTSYADILKADCLDEVVRELMMEQHKQMIRDLMQGKLDLGNAPHETAYQPAEALKDTTALKTVPTATKETTDPKSAESGEGREDLKEKSLDDIILDFLAQEQKEKNGKK